jgi:sarcosine oxidase delta subunit
VRFDPRLKPDAPYQSWGTEYVFVAEDRPDFIALQHILVQRVQGEGGKAGEPMVVRHWRQEWRYQPESLLAYEGEQTWARRTVPAEARRGAWSQSVLQVDDSPRYAAVGRWQHAGGVSTWISQETWRPLPRREFSVRKDYDVLVGTNRHTITQDGWLQEENNLKLALQGQRYLAREYGVARYQRIRNYDFTAGEKYYTRTEPFWAEVRSAWQDIAQRAGRFTLRAQVDQGQLFVPFFEYAAKLEAGAAFDREAARAFIRRTLQDSYLK